MEKIIEQNLQQIKQLMQQDGVERAYLFGSAARGTMKESSDVDFIIKFPDDMDFTVYDCFTRFFRTRQYHQTLQDLNKTRSAN